MTELAVGACLVFLLLAVVFSVYYGLEKGDVRIRGAVDFRFYKSQEIQKRGHYHKIVQ